MATTVAPDIVQKRLAHSKVVYLDNENVLIDSGPQSEWDELQTFLDAQGSVDTLFLSHAHGDHIGNADLVAETYDCEVLFPENEPFDDVPLSEEDVTRVSNGTELGSDARVIEVPGHTEGICAVHAPERRVLLATDVLDGSDRCGLPAGYLLPPPAIYNWDSDKAATNIADLLDRTFETVVVTHGSNVESEPHLKLDKYLNFPDHYRQELLSK